MEELSKENVLVCFYLHEVYLDNGSELPPMSYTAALDTNVFYCVISSRVRLLRLRTQFFLIQVLNYGSIKIKLSGICLVVVLMYSLNFLY